MSGDFETQTPVKGLGVYYENYRSGESHGQTSPQFQGEDAYNSDAVERSRPANPELHIRVKRDLGRWQVFFIIISGTIGLGLFVDSGKILSITGPWGGLLAFGLVGLCVSCIMETFSEMQSYWPIPNGPVEYVRTFIDSELSAILGFAYWCSWSITFATLINTAYDLGEFWTLNPLWQILLYNIVIPIFLLSINLLSVRLYGTIEVILGSLKVALILGICISMLVVNIGGIHNTGNGMKYIHDGFRNDPRAAMNPVVAVIVVIPIVAHAFCGVEIASVAMLEAKDQERSLKWFPTRHIAQMLLFIYLVTIFMLYLNISWIDPALRNLPDRNASAASIAMIIAINSRIPLLPSFLNACLIMVVLSSANTALYTASRSLYTLTRGLSADGVIVERNVHKLAKTTKNGVPLRAVLFSGLIFGGWLPFIHSTRQNRHQSLHHTLSRIATMVIVIAWMIQCIAFIRFRKWLAMRQDYIISDMTLKDRFKKSLPKGKSHNWLASLGSIMASIGLLFCLLTIAIFSSASLWGRGGSAKLEVAVWLGPAVLSSIWIAMKLNSTRWVVELSSTNRVLREALTRLDSLILRPRPRSSTSTAYGTMP